jgi:hypothetical protein
VKELLAETGVRASRYVAEIASRRVAPLSQDIARLEALGGAVPENPCDPAKVLALLDDIGSPATVATTGGRYFGFVTGATLPAALAANWLAGAWDQNAAMRISVSSWATTDDDVERSVAAMIRIAKSVKTG